MTCPMLAVSDGCTHGKCRFCDIYTGIPFHPIPMEEITADIDEIARTATALTRRIYLTGGNPFALSNERLIQIFDEVEARIICSHDSDVVRFDGIIPADQENMLKLMDNRIPKINEKAARLMREMIHKATF